MFPILAFGLSSIISWCSSTCSKCDGADLFMEAHRLFHRRSTWLCRSTMKSTGRPAHKRSSSKAAGGFSARLKKSKSISKIDRLGLDDLFLPNLLFYMRRLSFPGFYQGAWGKARENPGFGRAFPPGKPCYVAHTEFIKVIFPRIGVF